MHAMETGRGKTGIIRSLAAPFRIPGDTAAVRIDTARKLSIVRSNLS